MKMAAKTALKVLINGKTITLAGYEDEEYLQNVANYLNRKISGLSGLQGYRRMSADDRNILLALNIADDYFKAKGQVSGLEASLEEHEQDSYGIKQELVASQIDAEKLRNENESLKAQIETLNKNIETLKSKQSSPGHNNYGYRR